MKIPVYTNFMRAFLVIAFILDPVIFLWSGIWTWIEYGLIVFSIISLILFVLFLYLVIKEIKAGTLASTVEINQKGICYESKLHQYFIPWETVQLIGFHRAGFKFNRNLIFSAYYDLTELGKRHGYKDYSDNLIVLENRKGLVDEVRKHWNGTIILEEKFKR